LSPLELGPRKMRIIVFRAPFFFVPKFFAPAFCAKKNFFWKKMSGFYVISTLFLQSYLNLRLQSKEFPDGHEPVNMREFLNQVPYSSNYLIENWIINNKVHGKVTEISTIHRPSNTSIRRHIQLGNLSHKYPFVVLITLIFFC
jgi:hypothetical protein